MEKKNYIEDKELFYEIVLSKGKGRLTKRAEKMLLLIADRMIRKMSPRYKSEEDKYDCKINGILIMLKKWNNFNEKKYKNALPFFTEVFKRGISDGYNILVNRKTYNEDSIKLVSIDGSNSGKGMHNI